MTDLIALARACGADVYPNEIDFTPAQLAAFAARIAPPEAKTIDIERMLRECVPGGSVCDPQRVADDIREWFAAPPAAGAPDAMALLADYLESQEFHERCMDYRGATIAYVPAAFELLQESIEGAARKVLAAPAAPAVPTEALRKALELAVRQNSHDMLMTGEEIRKCEAALATEQAAPVQATASAFDLMKLVNRYVEACDDLGAGLFEQTEEQTKAKHAIADALYKQIQETAQRLHATNEQAQTARWFGELMAVMHRDGGQHLDAVGPERAARDAMETYYRLRAIEDASPVQAPAADFDSVWRTLPIPGEYDSMDAFDQQRWRGIAQAAFDAGRSVQAVPTTQQLANLARDTMYSACVRSLFDMGHAGANADTSHPLRAAWEQCRDGIAAFDRAALSASQGGGA